MRFYKRKAKAGLKRTLKIAPTAMKKDPTSVLPLEKFNAANAKVPLSVSTASSLGEEPGSLVETIFVAKCDNWSEKAPWTISSSSSIGIQEKK